MPFCPLQPVQQGGKEVGLGAGPNHKVVVVKGLGVAHEGEGVALAGQGSDGRNALRPMQVKAGQLPPFPEGVPPNLLPLGQQAKGIDRALGQQVQPFGPNFLEGVEGVIAMLVVKSGSPPQQGQQAVPVPESIGKIALTAVVTTLLPGFWTPRMAMQRCSASNSTATPRGVRAAKMASATWPVSRSCTWGRRQAKSRARASLLMPAMRPLGT